MKNICLVITTLGQAPEVVRIAKLLKSTNRYEPIIYFNQGIDVRTQVVQELLSNKFQLIDYNLGMLSEASLSQNIINSAIEPNEVQIFVKENMVYRLRQFVKVKFPGLFAFLKNTVLPKYRSSNILAIATRIAAKYRKYKYEKKLLQTFNIKLIVLAEDSEDYFTPQLVRAGKSLDIKSVVFPYTFANQFEFLEDAHFNNRLVKSNFFSWLAGTFYPKWTYRYKERNLIKSTPALIFSSEIFGDAPPNPWVMSSGRVDVIASESQFMKDYYVQAGLSAEKFHITGYLSLDSLSEKFYNRESFRQQIIKEFGFDEKSPIIVSSVVPSQWPRAGVGFESYDEFLENYFGYFKQLKNVNVIYKFHPRLGEENIKSICTKYGILYCKYDTSEIIAAADLYIASVSSTIRWALACGITTINYDIYNYGYGDFDSAKNYKTVIKFEDFKTQVNQFLNSFEIAYDIKKQMQPNFGKLDGKANVRILELFDKLVI